MLTELKCSIYSNVEENILYTRLVVCTKYLTPLYENCLNPAIRACACLLAMASQLNALGTMQ